MKTHVDWLRYRTQSSPFAVLEVMRPSSIGGLLELGEQERGKDGWEWRRALRIEDVTVGNIDYGGESQRGWSRVDMPAEGCKWVADWQGLHDGAMTLNRPEIKRLDLALDVFDGSVSHERTTAAYDAGGFTNRGRTPKAREILPKNGGDGRTFYVGRREGARFFRCYEKGWEVWSKVPETARCLVGEGMLPARMMVRGHSIDPAHWYRCEIQLNMADGYCPPWHAVKLSDDYFAGVCPYFAELVPDARRRFVQQVPDFTAKLELEASLEHLRVAYGGVIRAALMAGLTEAQVLNTITAERPSERLVKAGVLMLDATA